MLRRFLLVLLIALAPPAFGKSQLSLAGAGVALRPCTVSNAEATTYIAAMSSPPDCARQTAIDTLVGALKVGAISGSNIWGKLDYLQLYAAHDAQSSVLNAVSPAAITAVLNGSPAPTFIPDRGYDTDGTQSFVDTGFNPLAVLGHYVQDSGSFGLWSRKSATQTNNVLAGWFDGTDGITLNVRNTNNALGVRINQTSQSTTANSTVSDGSGLFVGNRSGASANQGYRNGVALTFTSNPNRVSTTMNSHTLQLGSQQAGLFEAGQFAESFASSSLTANEELDVYNALLAYNAALGF